MYLLLCCRICFQILLVLGRNIDINPITRANKSPSTILNSSVEAIMINTYLTKLAGSISMSMLRIYKPKIFYSP